MRWTRSPPHQQSNMCLNSGISERIITVDQDYHTVQICSTRWNSNLSTPHDCDRTVITKRRRFDQRTHDRDHWSRWSSIQRLIFNFAFYKNGSSQRRTRSRSFAKFSMFREPNRVTFVSLCSQLISASIEHLNSNFDRERRKKSHLELHFCLQKFGMKSLASGD